MTNKNKLNFSKLKKSSLQSSLQVFKLVFIFAKKNKLNISELKNSSLQSSLQVFKLRLQKFTFLFYFPKFILRLQGEVLIIRI